VAYVRPRLRDPLEGFSVGGTLAARPRTGPCTAAPAPCCAYVYRRNRRPSGARRPTARHRWRPPHNGAVNVGRACWGVTRVGRPSRLEARSRLGQQLTVIPGSGCIPATHFGKGDSLQFSSLRGHILVLVVQHRSRLLRFLVWYSPWNSQAPPHWSS